MEHGSGVEAVGFDPCLIRGSFLVLSRRVAAPPRYETRALYGRVASSGLVMAVASGNGSGCAPGIGRRRLPLIIGNQPARGPVPGRIGFAERARTSGL
jgi:hypothetical protein